LCAFLNLEKCFTGIVNIGIWQIVHYYQQLVLTFVKYFLWKRPCHITEHLTVSNQSSLLYKNTCVGFSSTGVGLIS